MHEPSDVTVELDGLGRQLSELPVEPGARPAEESDPARNAGPESSDRPVFVDASGRRSKKFRRAGWAVSLACACFAATVVVSIIGGNSSAPWLQIPGLADKKNPDTVEIQPAPTTSQAVGVAPGATDAAPTPTDSNGAVIPQSPGSPAPGLSGSPDPGSSNSAEPPKTPTGGSGGTLPDPGMSSAPGGKPGGGTGGPPPQQPPPSEPTTAPVDPSTPPPAEPPPAQVGGQQLAAEGAH
ncbi:hypothetical protein [Streptomyces sp. NPDC051569]|uniref:hypothetical protein n=1 Tax=Streptomyces sp. NPDC051569 TaxID=3365661 RepID=UPI0037B87A14